MARSFKQLLGDDIKNTRTLLHESIPITGTISSGTYKDNNIKNFSHGMFQNVYDYPYLSSSANHIFDVTFGYSSAMSASTNTQNAKKLNVYNQMAQVLIGYDTGSNIRKFDSDGTYKSPGVLETQGRMNDCFFLNFSRLLVKDEIKKNTFRLSMYSSGSVIDGGSQAATPALKDLQTIGDYNSATQFRTSPAGDFGLIYTSSASITESKESVGLIFYQAGVAVLTSTFFKDHFGTNIATRHRGEVGLSAAQKVLAAYNGPERWDHTAVTDRPNSKWTGVQSAITGSTIQTLADGFRHAIDKIEFNNTIELNSTIYFCRINHNEFNYSSNPTYTSAGRLVVKNNVNDLPVTYITTIGLYSPDNELLAVAKLSEPIRKDPNTELTLRVRLDY
jgi:hypothetical protein